MDGGVDGGVDGWFLASAYKPEGQIHLQCESVALVLWACSDGQE